MKLAGLLLLLAVALWLVVSLTGRYARPVASRHPPRWRWIITGLVLLLIILRLVQHYWRTRGGDFF